VSDPKTPLVLIGFRATQSLLDDLDRAVLDRRIAEGPKSKVNRALLIRELVEDGLRRLEKTPKATPRDAVRTRTRARAR
jgi:hypothetical protein